MPIALSTLATGDTNYITKHNNNYSAIQTAVNALETGKLSTTSVGAANGVASLGADGKVPTAQLPNLGAYEVTANKGAVNGYAALGADGKVPSSQLPASLLAAPPAADLAPYQQKVEKGAANGYAGLDASSKVPTAQLPDLSATYQVVSAKGNANGYASLDATGKVPSTQLPSSAAALFVVTAYVGGVPANAAELLAVLPTTNVSFVSGLTGSRAKAGVAATGAVTLSIKKNGTEVGTITFAPGGTAGTLTAAAQIDLTTADELTIVNQATADATLANIRISLHGTR